MLRMLPVPLVALAIFLGVATSGEAAGHKLTGVSGPGFTITVKSGTKAVKTLTAGSYTIVVADKSSIHNFHLFGPGVNKTTTDSFHRHEDLDGEAQGRHVHLPMRRPCRFGHEGHVQGHGLAEPTAAMGGRSGDRPPISTALINLP